MRKPFIAILFTSLAFACMTIKAIAAAQGTPITLSTALAFGDDSTCNESPNSPCLATGTFTANDQTTANLICASGTIFETHWFTHGRNGPITIADRTWTCPDGSTLTMHVLRWVFIPVTDISGEILETWVITGGTGRLARLQGIGTMDEIFEFGTLPHTLGGTVTGFVH
jgi:hypothetical protein